MYKILFFISSFLLFVSCKKEKEDTVAPCLPDNRLYYSDYFVFVADEGDPLVIPLDINWTPNDSGYLAEFKGWYGTTEQWPIAYDLNQVKSDLCAIPHEAWEHLNTDYFQFNASTREVITTIWEAPELRVTIPESSEWVQTPGEDDKGIYGCKTIAKVDGEVRSGWLIYERIRWDNEMLSSADFEEFYWIPILVNDTLYHFQQHKGEQVASKWHESDGGIGVSSISTFDFNIVEVSTDVTSGRDNIPEVIELSVADWGIDLKIFSGGSQVGYGPEFPNGLAYYRQSLVQTTADSENEGYGMLELIMENN